MVYYWWSEKLKEKGGERVKLPRAAQELDRSVSTLKRWIKSGYIKAVKIGRDWDISEKEIERIKSGRVRKRRVRNE